MKTNPEHKFTHLLKLILEYNTSSGKAHSTEFLCRAADAVGAELCWDGWYCEGFGCPLGYFPAPVE